MRRPRTFELELFDGESWVGQVVLCEGPNGDKYRQWVQAAAAGIVGELMAILALPDTHGYCLCAGWLETRPMLYEAGLHMQFFELRQAQAEWCPERPEIVMLPAREPIYYPRDQARLERSLLTTFFYTEWVRDGGIIGSKYWSPAFLIPEPVQG